MEAILIIGAIAVIFLFFRKRIPKDVLGGTKKHISIDDKYNTERRERELEIDRLLSKMGKNGVDDLSQKDRNRLEELSKK